MTAFKMSQLPPHVREQIRILRAQRPKLARHLRENFREDMLDLEAKRRSKHSSLYSLFRVLCEAWGTDRVIRHWRWMSRPGRSETR